ncbi:MAG TPA: C-GCAxxG-C-C family protein [Defluviitoga tunisiensis]|nr:C-GCAxxG-C-C family protein [Defluviitoga tunisiensis]HPP03868.1 C-GCAxxG-C-C family protein [Spirochaetota bacterium]
MKRSQIAIAKFTEGYNCAQSVLFSFCDHLNCDKDVALKISCGFGAGRGRKEEVCGAVTGGIMVIGLRYGRGEKGDSSFTEETYKKTREFMDKFKEKHGTFICRKLLGGCELTTPEGQAEFKEKDLYNKVCKQCVSDAVDILEKVI